MLKVKRQKPNKKKAKRHKYFSRPYPPIANTCLADKLREVLEKSKE